jgi:hypothetical protein
MKTLIDPKLNYLMVTEKRIIKHLFINHGSYYDNQKEMHFYECGVCGIYIGRYMEFEQKRDLITKHLITKHPEFCYSCSNCDNKFIHEPSFRDHEC